MVAEQLGHIALVGPVGVVVAERVTGQPAGHVAEVVADNAAVVEAHNAIVE